MNILQREAHKRFINPVATVDPLSVIPFMVTTLDPDNVHVDKKLLYSWVDSQVVTELMKNIFTNSEYCKLMLKNSMFTFQDDNIGNKRIYGPCLIKVIFDRIDPYVVVGVKVLRQNLKATKLHPYQNNVDDMLTDTE